MIKDRKHPSCLKNGYVFEHTVVMEKKIGRFLKPGESVHHKNGIRNDNSESNLELWATPHPSGQRVEDLVEWVVETYPCEVKKILGPGTA